MTVQTAITAETPRCLLFVGDDAAQKRIVTATAARAGWWVIGALDGDAAAALLADPDNADIGAVLVDRWETGGNGALLNRVRHMRPNIPVMILADSACTAQAVEAMRAGASDYFTKPLVPDRLLASLHAAADRRKGEGELRFLSGKLAQPLEFENIVGSSPEFRAALAVAAKAARSRVPVLIEGERGTGKELTARAIHHAGPRRKKPFVLIDCAAVAPGHVESALFGHEQGAFPGAFTRKAGAFENADGGTLFLENIDYLAPDTQAKVAKAVASGQIERVGGTAPISTDVRLIASIAQRLQGDAAAGLFDETLYAAFGAVHVFLPPLRSRNSDIPALSRHLLLRISEQPGMRTLTIADDALGVLMSYGWPGNVQQLQNVLFRAAILSRGDALTAADFPHIRHESTFNRRAADLGTGGSAVTPAPSAVTGNPGITLFLPDGHLRPLEDIEADVVRLAIGHYRGRMTEVARRLGIGRSTLYRKLGELGIIDAA
ncbi:sigma-54-dependent Fis family transcriptional regulator [Allosphingosinicella flava]|uniref:DNA-binding transcriptional regulator NtrC n=1 Tax=Allosphingosinicella flava TaxID=2771430 RepID=A0A7T2LN84_9SPHN|nr:sigma-54 dependent transcriptional regulator [Sphingosinicella flava]QPQ56108.1 sigma-54-dependent Fis family transcriptional regulator [Sphingosinicella flava]